MQSKTNPQLPFGELESEPYLLVQFTVEMGMNNTLQQEADLNMHTQILGLKEDMQYLFGIPPGHQEWSYQFNIMDDKLCLCDYVNLLNAHKITIHVKKKV